MTDLLLLLVVSDAMNQRHCPAVIMSRRLNDMVHGAGHCQLSANNHTAVPHSHALNHVAKKPCDAACFPTPKSN